MQKPLSDQRKRTRDSNGKVNVESQQNGIDEQTMELNKRHCVASTDGVAKSSDSLLSESVTAADGLQFLLGNEISMETFFKEHWERQPLLTRATPSRREWCEKAFSVEGLWNLVRKHELLLGQHLNMCRLAADGTKEMYVPPSSTSSAQAASTTTKSGSMSGINDHSRKADKREAEEEEEEEDDSVALELETAKGLFLDDKYTAQFFQPQRFSQPLWMLMQSLEREFGELWGSSAYLTPTESQGLAPHYDDVELFIIQTEGKKEWRLYNFAQPNARAEAFLPSGHSGDIPRIALQEPPFLKVVLEVGDVLYLPRGTVHEARTVQGHVSTHVTVSTYQNKSWGHLLGAFMNELGQSGYLSTAPFRPSLPLRFAREMSRGARVVTSMVDEMQSITNVGGSNGSIGTSFCSFVAPFVDSARVREMQESQQHGREQLARLLRRIADDVLVNDSLPDQVLAECLVPTDVDFCLHRLPPFVAGFASGDVVNVPGSIQKKKKEEEEEEVEEKRSEKRRQRMIDLDVLIEPKNADFTCVVEASAYDAMQNGNGGDGGSDGYYSGSEEGEEEEEEEEMMQLIKAEGRRTLIRGGRRDNTPKVVALKEKNTNEEENDEEEEEEDEEEDEGHSNEQLVVVNSASNLQKMHMEEQSDKLLSQAERNALESAKALVKPFDAQIQSVLAVLTCGSTKAVRMSELPWPVTMSMDDRAEILLELERQGVVYILESVSHDGGEKEGHEGGVLGMCVSRAADVARCVAKKVAPPAPPVESLDEDEDE